MQLVMLSVPSDIEVQWKLTCARVEEWISYDLFYHKWWIMLMLFIISIYIWWKLVDKSKLNEIVLYTGLITIIILVLDELGEELTLWDYTTDIIPIFPPISAIDLACMPMVYSLIYQYFKSWKSFVLATTCMALVFCFIGEPIFVWSGVYYMLHWKSYYGLPIYIAMALGTKFVVNRIYSISNLHRKMPP